MTPLLDQDQSVVLGDGNDIHETGILDHEHVVRAAVARADDGVLADLEDPAVRDRLGSEDVPGLELEIGSDTAGSIRIPSHFCGVFGLKPTEDRVSVAGHGELPDRPPGGLRHLVSFGPLARSVADLRLTLAVLEGPDPRRVEVPPVAPVARQPELPRPESMRIAWMDALAHCPTSVGTAAAVHSAVDALRAAGCRVKRAAPLHFDIEEALATWGEINGLEMGAMTPAPIRMLIRNTTFLGLGRTRWTRGLRGGFAMNGPRYIKALTTRERLIAELEAFLADFDAWLLPVAASLATSFGNSLRISGSPRVIRSLCTPSRAATRTNRSIS